MFDPRLLKQIAVDLAKGVRDQPSGDFAEIQQTITAVDGSVADTLSRVAGLAWVPKTGGCLPKVDHSSAVAAASCLSITSEHLIGCPFN